MGDTVEALAYKSDVPSRVKDAVNDRVETVKGTISDVVESVKDTLTGAGGKVGNALGGAKRGMSDTLSGATGTLRDATGTLRETTGNAGDTLSDTTSNLRSTVQNTISNTVGQAAGKLPNPGNVTSAARRGAGIAAENPLGLALGALAVGFLAGLAAPITDLEREKVGPLRDELVGRAKDLGTDALEHGKQVLQETAQAALGAVQQAAQEHGQQVLSEAKGDTVHGQDQNQDQGGAQGGDKRQGADSQGASAAGMPSDRSQGGGLRSETLSSGTGAQTNNDTGKTSSQYGVLLDDQQDTLNPGSPGTASP